MKTNKFNEKLRKQLEKEIERYKKPGQCLKLVTALIEETIINIGNTTNFIDNFKNLEGPTYDIIPLTTEALSTLPQSIRWIVNNQSLEFTDDTWKINSSSILDERVLLILSGEDFISLAKGNWKNTYSCPKLISLIEKEVLKLTIIIVNLEYELLKLKSTKKRSKESDELTVDDVKSLLFDLKFENEFCILPVSDYVEAGKIAACYTKSIAEKEFKRCQKLRSSGGLFSLTLSKQGSAKVLEINADGVDNNNKEREKANDKYDSCRVDPDCDSNTLGGVDHLWRIQLTNFRGVTNEMAECIRDKFPTPFALYQHFHQCNSEKEAINQIADIEIRRGTEFLTNSRRIGKEIATRIYNFICADPDSNVTVM